jgi:hypothetical protein
MTQHNSDKEMDLIIKKQDSCSGVLYTSNENEAISLSSAEKNLSICSRVICDNKKQFSKCHRRPVARTVTKIRTSIELQMVNNE